MRIKIQVKLKRKIKVEKEKRFFDFITLKLCKAVFDVKLVSS